MEENLYELLYMARSNDEQAFILLQRRFSAYVGSLHQQLYRFIPSLDREEMDQLANIGIYNAVACYRPDMNMSFSSFVILCIRREVQNYIRKNKRNYYFEDNAILSLDGRITEDENLYLLDTVADGNYSDSSYNTAAEMLEEQIRASLNDKEYTVYRYKIAGYSYEEIAQKMNLKTKQVDYLIQVMRKKIRELLDCRDE